MIGAAVCWLVSLHSTGAEEYQRGFASADEAVNALVTALREHNEADWPRYPWSRGRALIVSEDCLPTSNSLTSSLHSTMRSARLIKRCAGARNCMSVQRIGHFRYQL